MPTGSFLTRPNWLALLLGLSSLLGLHAISRYNFLLFHCLAEAFSIIIAVAVFAIFWNTRQYLENGFYLVIGCGCLFAGVLDVIYIFGYKGMSVFPGADGNTALQAKTVAQWFVSLSCVGAFAFVRRKIDQNLAFSVYGAILALALASIFYWRAFPDCYVEGVGQTLFEKLGLVVSCSAYLCALALLIRNRREFDRRVFAYLAAISVAFFAEDFASALATNINGSGKTTAHLCQVVALYFVYKAFVEVGLRKPYDLLFRRQQQTSENLTRSVSMLRATLESTADGILVVDLQGRFVEFNQEFAVMWLVDQDLAEVSREDDPLTSIHAQRMMQSVLGQLKDPEGFLARVAELYTQPEASSFDVLEFKDGRIVERFSQPQRISNRAVGRVWSFRDVTNRRRAEESLRRSRDQLARFAENLPYSIIYQVMLDANGNRHFSYFSATVERILGIAAEDVTADADSLFRLIPKPYRTVLQQAQAESTRNRSLLDVELPFHARDGSVKWLHICSAPYQREDGQPMWDGIATDVTDRKRMEESLRESERFLAAVLNSMAAHIVVLDPKGCITAVNEPWLRFARENGVPDVETIGVGANYIGASRAARVAGDPFAVAAINGIEAVLQGRQQQFAIEYPCPLPDRECWFLMQVTANAAEIGGAIVTHTDITDRKRAEEALRQSEEGLRLVLEASGTGWWRLDYSSGTLTTDDRGKALLGVPTTTEPTFAAFLDRIAHADRPTAEQHFAQALVRPGDYQGEYHTVWPDGRLHCLLIKGRAFHDAAGKPRRMEGIVMDATDRKRAEEKVLASEANLLEAQEIARLGSYVLDIPQGHWSGSHVLNQIFDIPADLAMTVEEWGNLVHPEERQAMLDYFRNDVLGRHEPFDREYRIVRFGDNQVRWVHGLGRLEFDAAGHATVMIGTIQDITDRKRAEEALRASEERHRLLVETIPQLAWCLSPEGLNVDCNRRWHEYTGQTAAQVRGHGWLAAVHPGDLLRVAEQAALAASTKEPYELEYRLRRAADGGYRCHLVQSVPALAEDGHLICWIGCATDIEELKQAQEILKQTHDEQLQRHQAELAHVARLSMMGEMAASLAHELNQPLHAVKNYAYGSICRLQKMPERDEEFVVALEQICEETTRAAEIIRRIKAFVQKREPRFLEVIVNSLVEEAVLFSKTELGRRQAKIVLDLANDLPSVLGDAIQIEQVIMNLVRNGLEAMDETPEENRLLAIKTLRHGPGMVLVEISDRGKGIGEKDLKKAFEPFFTTKPEGMGMGLAISRSIIQTHQGRIWVSANQDQGCTFHFTLPVGKRS